MKQLAVEYESNAIIVKVDTDDEYEFARDMQVYCNLQLMFLNFMNLLSAYQCKFLH